MQDTIRNKDFNYIAVIMAGGKATRFDFSLVKKNEIILPAYYEKALLKIGNKPIIDHQLNSLLKSGLFSHVIIASSPNCPGTHYYIKNKQNFELSNLFSIQTSGINYHSDQKEILKYLADNPKFRNSQYVWFISGDIPFIRPPLLIKIDNCFTSKNRPPSLVCLIPASDFEIENLNPTYIIKGKDGDLYVPAGINIINKDFYDYKFIPQEECPISNKYIMYNVNTFDMFKKAKKFFNTQSEII